MKPIKQSARRVTARKGGDLLVQESGFVYVFPAKSLTGSCVGTAQQFEARYRTLVAKGWVEGR